MKYRKFILFTLALSLAGCGFGGPLVPAVGLFGQSHSGKEDTTLAGKGNGDGSYTGKRECSGGPLSSPISGCNPAMLPSTGNPYIDCVTRINQFRWECQCLPNLKRWKEAEDCATKNAKYDASANTAHKGFSDNICQGTDGKRPWATNECPKWGDTARMNKGCIKMMWDEGPGSFYGDGNGVHGHYLNLSSTQYTKVACGFGSGWGVHLFN